MKKVRFILIVSIASIILWLITIIFLLAIGIIGNKLPSWAAYWIATSMFFAILCFIHTEIPKPKELLKTIKDYIKNGFE